MVAPLPARLGYLVGRVVADITFLLSNRSRNGVSANVRHALGPFPDKRLVNHVTLAVFRNNARNLFDVITLPRLDPATIEHRLTIHGWHHFEQALAQKKGVILASIHMGNMDMAVQVIKARSVKLTILSEMTQPPQYYALTRKLREHHGISLLPVTYSGLKVAIRRLRKGEVVAIACDRAIQSSGLRMEFLGEKALIPVGAVDLALRTGAAIVPGFATRLQGYRYAFFFEPPINIAITDKNRIREPMSEIIKLMEHYIRRFPDQWMVFDPIWNNSSERSSEDHVHRNEGVDGIRRQRIGAIPSKITGASEYAAPYAGENSGL